jgi:hypothetical protein
VPEGFFGAMPFCEYFDIVTLKNEPDFLGDAGVFTPASPKKSGFSNKWSVKILKSKPIEQKPGLLLSVNLFSARRKICLVHVQSAPRADRS